MVTVTIENNEFKFTAHSTAAMQGFTVMIRFSSTEKRMMSGRMDCRTRPDLSFVDWNNG